MTLGAPDPTHRLEWTRPFRGLHDYQLHLCLAELARLKGEDWQTDQVWRMPHVRSLLETRGVVAAARHTQNLIWTAQRVLSRLRGEHRKVKHEIKRDVGQDVREQLGHPSGPRPAPDRASASRSRRVYVDVTATVHGVGVGGIPRTVTKLVEAAAGRDDVVPVVGEGGRLWPVQGNGCADRAVIFAPGDVYLMIDQFWYSACAFAAVCEGARAAGASCVLCVYDLIPLLYPALIDRAFAAGFADAFPRAVAAFDRIVTISASSADEIRAYLREHHGGTTMEVASFRLGSDATADAPGPVREAVAALFRQPGTSTSNTSTPGTFLSVGSVLPHKGHLVALAAMEAVWRSGREDTYVIMGGPDRTMDCINDAIASHPEAGRRLHWVRDATDAEVRFAYRHAACLIQPSVAEGFGLPVVEALRHATPVLASDIPVFREVGGDAVTYFDLCDSAMLARRIAEGAFRSPPVGRADVISWRESLRDLLRVLDGAPAAAGRIRATT